MRNIALITLLMGAISSMATTRIILTSDDYTAEAELIAGASMMAGTVTSDTEDYGHCEGTYSVNQAFMTTTIMIDFPSPDCHLQSMEVIANNIYYPMLMSGAEIPVIFKQLQFYSQEKAAKLKMISRS